MKKIYGLLLLASLFVMFGCTKPAPTKVRVTFYLNYEGAPETPESQLINKGTKAVVPTAPVRDGYNFINWYEDKVGNKLFDFEKEVNSNISVYAVWELIPDYTPIVNRRLYHWVPNALEANVDAIIDLKTADVETFKVTYNEEDLEEFIDYELDGNELTIYGTYLQDANLSLGEHTFKVSTEHGEANFTIEIVENASLGSSIPKQTIKGLNMSQIASFTPNAVIEGAPELMITEVATDMGEYSYIELFNNTDKPYNLKNHRIVFANLTLQKKIASHGLFEQPLGMGSAMYIYQDYVIPALGSAVIWILTSYPWVQADGQMANEATGKVLTEAAGFEKHLIGNNPENLSIEKFRKVYNLPESVLVFTTRTQPCLVNAESAAADNGLGAAPIKASGSMFTGVNGSMADRGFQIQKFDLEKKFTVSGIDGVSYYKYDVGVLNQEEDLYVDGVLDKSKMEIFGGRETINAFYARFVFYNEDDEIVGYGKGANGIDAYNANKTNYLKMYDEIVTPLSTALIYADYSTGTASKWPPLRSFEYTIPEEGSTLMRYIPVAGMHEIYLEKLATENPLKLMGLAPEVEEISFTTDIEVPVSNAYPTDYLDHRNNTIGRLINYNFVKKD